MLVCKMRFLFFICLVLLLVYGCAPSPYKIIGDAEYANTDFKYILISQRYSRRSVLLSQIINASHWEGFDAEIKLVTDRKLKDFLVAIRLLKEGNARDAYTLLRRLDENDFDCQVRILKVDCLSALKIDSIDFRRKYQEAFDCMDNPTIKNIAKTHYRFHKYGQ
jgi:hypothetical protein